MALTSDEIASLIDLNSARNASDTALAIVTETDAETGTPTSADGAGVDLPSSGSDGVDVGDNQFALVKIMMGRSPAFLASWFRVDSAVDAHTYDLDVDGNAVSYEAGPSDDIESISDELDTVVEGAGDYGVTQFTESAANDSNRVINTSDGSRPVITTTSNNMTLLTDATSVTFTVWGYHESVWYRLGVFEQTVADNYMERFGCSTFTRMYVQVTSISGTADAAGRCEVIVAPCDEQVSQSLVGP